MLSNVYQDNVLWIIEDNNGYFSFSMVATHLQVPAFHLPPLVILQLHLVILLPHLVIPLPHPGTRLQVLVILVEASHQHNLVTLLVVVR